VNCISSVEFQPKNFCFTLVVYDSIAERKKAIKRIWQKVAYISSLVMHSSLKEKVNGRGKRDAREEFKFGRERTAAPGDKRIR
jgi:hypothetical protein